MVYSTPDCLAFLWLWAQMEARIRDEQAWPFSVVCTQVGMPVRAGAGLKEAQAATTSAVGVLPSF
jgi:hypothetical protein